MANPYDDLVAQPTPTEEAGNPYDAVIGDLQAERQTRTRAVFERALAVNPDQAAENKRLANSTGLPADVVERNRDEIRRKEQARLLDIARMAQESPVLARQLMDPSFTTQAHDDVSALGQVEQFFRDTGGSMKAGAFNANKGAAGVFRAGFEFAAPALDVLEPITAIGGNPLRRLAEGFAAVGAAAGETAKAATPKTEGNISSGVQSGIQSLTQNLLALPIAFLPGGQGAALGMMSATTGGQSYQDARAKGLSMSQALPFAASQAAIEYATERIPLGDLVRDLKIGSPVVKLVTNQLKGEVIGEQIATVLQDMNEWAVLNPEKPFRDYIDERPNAAAQTLVATLVGTGGNIAVAKGIETATRKLMGDAYDAGLADQHAEQLQAALQTSTQSKLRERNPSEFRALVQGMADNTEGAPAEVFIDAEVLNQLAPEILAQLPQSVQDQMPDALAANDVVSIPVADVLTVAPGTPLEQMLIENARIGDAGAMSQAEAKVSGEQAQQYLAQEAERVIAQATDAQAMQESSDRVKAGIFDQLQSVGRFRRDVNDAYAAWATAFYTTMGGRLGLTPEEMAAKYPLRIAGQGGQQSAVLNGATQGQTPSILKQEDQRDLVLTHNLSAENLLHAVKMGGIPVPSLAITKKDTPLSGFGEITLIGSQAMADPKGYAGTKVFGADIYSPRYPEISYNLDKFAAKRLNTLLAPFRAEGEREIYSGDISRIDDLTSNKAFKAFADPEGKASWSKLKASAKSLLERVGADEKIFQGYTNSGNRKYTPHTLENVVKILKKELRGGENFNYGVGSLRAKFTPQFKSIAQIKKAKGRLIDKTTFEAVKKEVDDELVSIAEALELSLDQTIEVFEDAPKFGVTRAIERALKDYRSSAVPDDAVKTRVAEFLTRLRNLPTQYFEAKILRDVDLTEFAGAVVPDNVDPQALAALKARGVTGIRTYKSGDEADRAVKIGEFENLFFQGPRGTFNPDTLELALNENADLSTFLHESGHFFLEVMADLSSQADAPADIQQDMAALLKWFGVPDLQTWNSYALDQKRKYHERFAESFEQYLLEGKAPSVELQPLFRKFSAWLKHVYRSLKAFTDRRTRAAPGGETLGQAAFTVKPPKKLYRGLASETSQRAGGAAWASLGRGLYSTPDKKFAKQYGEVVELTPEEAWPRSPFTVDSAAGGADNAVWNAIRERGLFNGRRSEFDAQYPFLEDFLVPLGYDGVVAGDEVVRYTNETLKQGDQPGGPDIQLSPEVRQVFDRMLASEEQITEAEQVAGLLPEADATTEAVEKLTARSLRDLKWTVNARAKEIKKLQKQAAELRKGVEAEVRAEVEAQPLYAALKFLRTDTKLSIEGLESLYAGEGDRYALFDWSPLVSLKLAGKEGAHPDIVADMFGFASGDALVREVIAAEPIGSVIEGMTDQRMLEEHGDLIDDRAIEQAANEAIHNEARAKSLATELKAQADALNPRTDTGATSAAGSRITVNALAEAAKQFAANVVARTPLRDLKNRAWQHTAAERRAAKRWQEHTAKAETQEAVKAKQDQMLNHAAARAAMAAQAEMRKIIEFFRRVVKDGNEKTVEKGRDPDVVNAARAILGAYGIAPTGAKTALEYMAIVEKSDPAMYAALQPSMQAALNMAQPLDALTMDELRGLHEEIRGMWHLAKRSRQMEVDGNMMDLEDAADELQARMQDIGVPDTMPGDTGAVTAREEFARKLQHAGSLLRRTEQWAEGMGAEFTKLIFRPVKAAADAYRTDRVKYRKAYQALVDQVAPFMPKGTIPAPELGYTFGQGHNGIGMAELLHAILHTGNESNKRKLLLGRKWATENPDDTLDTSKWDAFLTRLIDSGALAKPHFDFAQGVWDLLEETKPLAQKTHRDVFGRYFAEVTANEFTTPFGTYRGGYVPAQADPRLVQDADLRKLAEAQNENMSFSFPATNKGFTKSRVEYNRPLLLDLRTIGQHIDKVLLFSHMEPAVRDVNRLLSRKGVAYSLGRIDPTIYAGMLTPWLHRAGKQIVETPMLGDGGISRVLSTLRARAGMSLMFANVSNTLQQVTGFSTAFSKLKADGLESHMMRATAQFIAHPKQMAKDVAEASPFMVNRMENEIASINDAIDQILLNPNLYRKSQAWFRKHAYFMQSAFDNTMGPIIWTAAYNGHLTKHGDEKAAAQYADSVIRQTQGSTLPEDVSRLETGNAAVRIFTQFVGYFNMMANTNATALKQIAQETGFKKGAGKALMVVTLGMLVPIWTAEMIAIAMRGGPGDEDKDGYLDDWLAAVFGLGTIKGSFAMVPFVGQLANAAINRMNKNPADDKMSLSPAVSLLESAVGIPSDVYKALTDPDKLSKRNAVRDVASAISLATGLPATALARPVGYLAGVADDRITPTDAADQLRGMLTGSASPESR